ncbi:JAB domain-containing protein [Eggerthia catenaformis]
MASSKEYKLDQVGIRMVKEPTLYSSEPVDSPEAAVRLISKLLKHYDRELLCIVNLRNDLRPINVNVVSVGTVNSSVAHPREIMKSAILSNASSVMLFHNHPSGNLTPSKEDIALTDRMLKAGEILGIPVIDHIIIGNNDQYYSFNEKSVMKVPRISYTMNVDDLQFQKTAVFEPATGLSVLSERQEKEEEIEI